MIGSRVGETARKSALHVLIALAFFVAACDTTSPEPNVLKFVPAGTTQLRMGLTHTQESIDPWKNADAAARAEAWLSGRIMLQNQHLMGWGALNPEPAPGQYDWRRLDERIDLIERTAGIPVLTLCCAPDWMKGGQPGETDWSKLEEEPLPEHFEDFAALAAEAARRYPSILHFPVWNEMKGFYLAQENRWDYEGYTRMYNLVYSALKAVRPEARVGGPYVVMSSWASRDRMSHPSNLSGPWGVLDQRSLDVVSYWLEHNEGAEFVAVDFGTHTSDAGLVTDPFVATQKFRDVVGWISSRTDLPIWLTEWYAEVEPYDRRLQTAVMMTAVVEMARAGVSAALQWGPEANDGNCEVGGCLWTGTDDEDGGRPTELGRAFKAFQNAFPPGTQIFEVQGLPAYIGALATEYDMLLINQQDQARQIETAVRTIELAPYEVAVVARRTAG